MLAVTHDGPFHADDVLAAAILIEIYGTQLEIVRTRDPEIIEIADIVFDVGSVYDVNTRRYDHHQRDGAGARYNGIPYSSAGLVWAHEYECFNDVREFVDERLVQGVDAGDNGVSLYDSPVRPMDFNAIVAQFNPDWNDEEQDFDYCFFQAVDFARSVLRKLIAQAESQVEAALIIDNALKARAHQEIVVLDRFCPWQQVLADYQEVLYVVFPDTPSGTWRIQCVPKEHGGFESRKPLPSAWHGLNGVDLDKVTGASGSVFCHRNGFIAGFKEKEWAVLMAYAAVN